MDDIFYWPSRNFGSWTGVWPEAFGIKDCKKKLSRTNGGYYSINYVKAGAVDLKMAHSAPHTVREKEVFLIPPGHFYNYQANGNALDTTELFWIRLTGPLAESYLHLAGLDEKKAVLSVKFPELFEEKIRELRQLYESYDEASDSEVIALLYHLVSVCTKKPNRSALEEKTLAQRIRDFMFDELETGYNVSQIAAFFGISRSSLFLHFKKEFRENPVRVLQNARVEKAKYLLRETGLKVEEIARASGYSNLGHFLHHFKAEAGKTPTGYRSDTKK